MARGWSIQRLAEEVGAHPGLVGKWLHPNDRRRVTPSRENLKRLAEVTGVPYGQLRRYVDPDDVDGDAERDALDPALAVVNAAWPRLEDWRRKAIGVLAGIGGGGLIDAYLPEFAGG